MSEHIEKLAESHNANQNQEVKVDVKADVKVKANHINLLLPLPPLASSNHHKRHYVAENDIADKTKGIKLPVKPTIPSTPIVPHIQGTKRALLVGINYTGTENQLNGCINDIKNIKNLLVNNFSFLDVNIIVLTDDNANAKPTKKNIMDKINYLVSITKAGDELFMHYSGHGSQIPSVDNDEDANPDTPGQDDCLCPCDFGAYEGYSGFIVDDDLRSQLVDKLPHGAKLRAFFDCCHSGSAMDLPYLYKNNNTYFKVEPDVINCKDALLISGCRDSQTSADAYINRTYSGALTWDLLKVLNDCKKIPTTWDQLLIITRHYLASGGYDQVPILSLGDESISNLKIDL